MSRFINIHMNVGDAKKFYIMKRREYLISSILLLLVFNTKIFWNRGNS